MCSCEDLVELTVRIVGAHHQLTLLASVVGFLCDLWRWTWQERTQTNLQRMIDIL